MQTRIDRTKALIIAYEDCLLALASNKNKSYSINTGQTTETVSQKDIPSVQSLLETLYSQLDYFDAMLSGTVSTIVVPGF